MFDGKLKAQIVDLQTSLIQEQEALQAEYLTHADAMADLKADHQQEIARMQADHEEQTAWFQGHIEALKHFGKQRDFMLQFGPYHMAGKGEINGVTFQLIEGRVDYHQANFRLPVPDGEVGL